MNPRSSFPNAEQLTYTQRRRDQKKVFAEAKF
jgi:hypothetical protein